MKGQNCKWEIERYLRCHTVCHFSVFYLCNHVKVGKENHFLIVPVTDLLLKNFRSAGFSHLYLINWQWFENEHPTKCLVCQTLYIYEDLLYCFFFFVIFSISYWPIT